MADLNSLFKLSQWGGGRGSGVCVGERGEEGKGVVVFLVVVEFQEMMVTC